MDRRARIDERIKTLLTTTDLTFKQIIEKLRAENMSASFNTIRRVNRNHRFRKPRYDAKLTPQQRKELVVILKNTAKPNLSSLARQYGVCHGSIWYWWDKLSKIREKNNGYIPDNDPSLECDDLLDHQDQMNPSFNDNHQLDDSEMDLLSGDPDSDPLDLEEDECCIENGNTKNHLQQNLDELEMVGSVQAKDVRGEYIKLPIIMYAPASSSLKNLDIWNTSNSMSSLANITPTTSTGQTSSLSKRLVVN